MTLSFWLEMLCHFCPFPLFADRASTDHLLPELDDFSSFRQWLLPADHNTTFRVAVACSECIDGQFGDNTAYHAFGGAFCKEQLKIDSRECGEDQICGNQCDVEQDSSFGNWTNCYGLHESADYQPSQDHSVCTSRDELIFRPTISMQRDGCTCFQSQSERIEYEVALSELPLITSTADTVLNDLGIPFIADNIQFDPDWTEPEHKTLTAMDARDSNVVRLYESDFLDGTYRIVESGTYVIMEDIAFDFNGPSDLEMASDSFSPNNIDGDELHWFPTHSQAVRGGAYPGLFDYEGVYTLGFFAGITVEADFVTIDLNGHRLQQSERFYFQQRFFSLIELASRTFLPGAGQANWGLADVFYASNVEVKDGILGRSSHHGIHGLKNNEVLISNVNVEHFDIAGLQCNGCHNVVIRDCKVGPQNQDIPVLGRYTHARSLLPRLKQLVDEHGDEELTFYGRDTVTVSDLADRLTNQMDMVYFAHFEGVQYAEDDEEWIAAQKMLANPTGWNDGGSSYGIVFGGEGAQVKLLVETRNKAAFCSFSFSCRPQIGPISHRISNTNNITLENVEILGIGNAAIEKMKFVKEDDVTTLRLLFFDPMDWVAITDQIDDKSTSKYVGDAYSDLVFAIDRVESSWSFLYALTISTRERSFIFDGDNEAFQMFFNSSHCGTDIQTHSSKGAIGLRVDGVQNLNVNGLFVHDIANIADIGGSWCGEYEGTHLSTEDIDIQYGYTATRSHGVVLDYVEGKVANLQIEGIESFHGEANGLTVYKGCDVALDNVAVDVIRAGTAMTQQEVDQLVLPNLTPRACGVDIRNDTVVTFDGEGGPGIFSGDDIEGFETCDEIPSSNQLDAESKGMSSARSVDKDEDSFTTIFSSCGEIDGLFYLKPSPDLGILPLICSNGYAMIDGYLDRNLQTLSQFLSSWDYGISCSQ